MTKRSSDQDVDDELGQYKLEPIDIADLQLDKNNPRLPTTVHGKPEREILKYLRENGELTELARSFADNGYFVQEPILVVASGRKFRVLEGNRRVATLKLLLLEDSTPFIDVSISDKTKSVLRAVPAIVLDNETELHRYVGFRHISGLQPWSPEAKARYLYGEVNRIAKEAPHSDPFSMVARRVGLKAPQIRQAYIAYATLVQAAKIGINADGITDHAKKRFGVWLRAMESPEIRKFIGLSSPKDYRSTLRAIDDLEEHKDALREVINDIGPLQGSSILDDSRNVTLYARVLGNAEALKAKRDERSLDVAREIVVRDRLPARLTKIERTISAFDREVSALEEVPDEETVHAVDSVYRAALRLRGTIRSLQEALSQ